MIQKNTRTTNQMNTLIRRSENFENFAQENADLFIDIRFSDYLYQLLEEHNMIPADLVEKTPIDRSYIYHIMSGKRKPGRETVLLISFALHLNLEQVQLLLRLADRPVLYPRCKQDAAIIFCIYKKKSLAEANDLLCSLGYPAIGKTER